jgi:hypothetical protein
MKILKAVAESRCLEHCKVIITPYFLDNRIEFRYAHAAVDNGKNILLVGDISSSKCDKIKHELFFKIKHERKRYYLDLVIILSYSW